jgi:hypothetical protein
MTTHRETLVAARALIADERNWLQRHYAQAADGSVVSPTSPTAKCFCVIGALCNVEKETPPELDGGLLFTLFDALPPWTKTAYQDRSLIGALQVFNDDTTHKRVLDVFDRAIAAHDLPAGKE